MRKLVILLGGYLSHYRLQTIYKNRVKTSDRYFKKKPEFKFWKEKKILNLRKTCVISILGSLSSSWSNSPSLWRLGNFIHLRVGIVVCFIIAGDSKFALVLVSRSDEAQGSGTIILSHVFGKKDIFS